MKILDTTSVVNYWMNGNLDIWQRAASFTHTAPSTTTTADRLQFNSSGSPWALAVTRVTAPAYSLTGVQSNFAAQVGVGTAKASLSAGDAQSMGQKIEGFVLTQLLNQRFITLSFWVNANFTGQMSVSLQNSASDRSYVVPFNVTAANVWQKVVIPFDLQGGNSTGTWNYQNGLGLRVELCLGAGTTFSTSNTSQWISGTFFGATGNFNFMGSTSNTIQVSAFMLNTGIDAAPFALAGRHFGEEVLLCQRYYEKSYDFGIFPGASSSPGAYRGESAASSSTQVNGCIIFTTRKRASPVMSFWNEAGTSNVFTINGNNFTVSVGSRLGETELSYGNSGGLSGLTTNGAYDTFGHYAADAEL